MFQREFAMRLFAQPGTKIILEIVRQCPVWAKISHVMKVGKNNFNPPPQVESDVVKIVPKVRVRKSATMSGWFVAHLLCPQKPYAAQWFLGYH